MDGEFGCGPAPEVGRRLPPPGGARESLRHHDERPRRRVAAAARRGRVVPRVDRDSPDGPGESLAPDPGVVGVGSPIATERCHPPESAMKGM